MAGDIEAKFNEFNEHQLKIFELLLRDPNFDVKTEAKKLSLSVGHFGTVLTSIYKALDMPADVKHMKKRQWVYDKYHAEYDRFFNREEWDRTHPPETTEQTLLKPTEEPPVQQPEEQPQEIEPVAEMPVVEREIFIKTPDPIVVEIPKKEETKPIPAPPVARYEPTHRQAHTTTSIPRRQPSRISFEPILADIGCMITAFIPTAIAAPIFYYLQGGVGIDVGLSIDELTVLFFVIVFIVVLFINHRRR